MFLYDEKYFQNPTSVFKLLERSVTTGLKLKSVELRTFSEVPIYSFRDLNLENKSSPEIF